MATRTGILFRSPTARCGPMSLYSAKRTREPEFTRELLRAQWRDGDPIDLYVIRPAHVEKPPVVLYLYSYPSDTRRFLDNAYCERVTRDGFAAVGFVSALTGHRYHGRPMKQWFVSELQESIVLSVHDVQMVLNYLASRSDLDVSSAGMFGAGSGGSIAILSVAVDKRIKAVDLLDPWGDWPDWMAKSSLVPEAERPQYLKPEFLKRVAPFDPAEWLPQLKSQTIRLEHVVDDSVTPPNAKQKIERPQRRTPSNWCTTTTVPPSSRQTAHGSSFQLDQATTAAGRAERKQRGEGETRAENRRGTGARSPVFGCRRQRPATP